MKLHASLLPLFLALPFLALAAEDTRFKGNKLEFKDLADLKDQKVASTDKQFKGKAMLVDIFGTWCPPCRAEIPHLVELSKKYKEKGLEVVGISFEREEDEAKRVEAVKAFAKKNNIEYTILLGGLTKDVEKVFKGQIQGFSGFPTLVFISAAGKVEHVEVGFPFGKGAEVEEEQKKTLADFEKRIQKLLPPAPASAPKKSSE